MSVRRITCVLVLAIALGAGSASPVAAASRSCASSDRFLGSLKADGLSCSTARTIMFAWARTASCAPGSDGTLAQRVRRCTVRRYRCAPRRAEGAVAVRCVRGGRALRFIASA